MEVVETLTPSGIAIRYQEKPRRYWLMVPDAEMQFRQVPSVTEALRVLDKPALKWWAMQTGVAGVIDLIDRYGWREEGIPKLTVKEVTDMLTREKLTVNHVSGKAADRGVAAHKALEHFIEKGDLPDERKLPKGDRGFRKALDGFLSEYPIDPIHSELLVGSRQYQYAGRFDLIAEVNGRIGLFDLKTSAKARVYDEALLQLAAYEGAYEESGYEPLPDFKAVVCVAPDGSYKVKESHCTPEDYHTVLACWRVMDALKESTDSRGTHLGRKSERPTETTDAGTRSSERAA